MSYTPEMAAALSGASVRQLAYWRSAQSANGPLLRPDSFEPGTRLSYSFQDVLALRTFVYLRAHKVPLQRVRKAVSELRALGEGNHVSAYKLVAVGRDVVWRVSADEAIALSGYPGQHVIAEMVDILGDFESMNGRRVVPLFRPTEGVRVDPDVRGGYPVIEGTRVPYDIVAGLLADGVEPAEVSAFYPSVSPEAAEGALSFEQYVDGYRAARAA
ncbi:MAG TPA: DUF433 domain-containing protein [Nocardioidaceae bacterium]|nr:DUF433 domain-containing protein [Nocardioidaceae bacterium]